MKFEKSSRPTTEAQIPDYAYVDGLRIVSAIYGNNPSQTEQTLSHEEMRPIEPLSESVPVQEKVIKRVGATAIEYLHIRSSAGETGEANVMFMGYGGNNANPITQDALRHHVAHNPNAALIHINNPAQGGTSILPRSVSREIARTGYFTAQGELHAKILESTLKNYDRVNIAGHSYGARQAIAFAGALDQPVNALHLLDPPGSRELGGLLGITKAFITLEGKHAGLYGEHARNRAAAAIQRQGDSTPIYDIVQLIRNHGLSQQFFDQTRAMSKAGLEHDLAFAAGNILNAIKLTSPALSELNYVDDVSAIIRRVAEANHAIQHDILLQHDILSNHTHSLTVANPDTLAYIQRFE